MPEQGLHGDTTAHAPSDTHAGGSGGKWVWGLIFVLLVAAGVPTICINPRAKTGSAQADAAPRAVPVSTAAARQGDIGVYINALGTVTPVYTDTITSRVQGKS